MGYTRTCKLSTLSGFGVFLSVFGSCFVVYWPEIFDSVLNNELALTNHSKSFELWEVTPIPMYIEFYFFNWTNPDELKEHGKKPILQELGPYVFREHRRKVIHAWHANGTITFRQNRTWHFEPSLSNGSLDDNVQTLNIPAIAAAFSCRDMNRAVKLLVDKTMHFLYGGVKLHVVKKVREFLFEGYSDPLLDAASIIHGIIPVSIPFDKFGWFYTRNGSADYDGIFNMRTGVKDISHLGELEKWDYRNQTTFYKSYCGYVNGSAGEFFPPNRQKTSISLFSPDICRTLDLTYKEEVEVDGIPGYRYWGDDKMFANETQCPNNWCFCPAGVCPPHGALDVSTCKWGAPAYVSFPHYYHADQLYRDAVIGMQPEEAKHQMYIDLEPRSGIPMQVSAAFQINILLQQLAEFSFFKDVPKIYFPAVWFRQMARIDDELRPQLKLITTLPEVGTLSSLVLLSLGVTILLVVGIFYLTNRCQKNDESFHGLVNAS